MRLAAIESFKIRLRIYVNGSAALVALSFMTLQHYSNMPVQGWLSLLASLYFITVVYILYSRNRYLWNGRAFLIFIPPALLNTMHNNPDFGVFWAYAGIVGIFLVLEFKDAVIGAIVFALISLFLVSQHHEPDVLYRIYTSVVMVGLFAFAFSLLIERLLDKLDLMATRDPLTNARNRHTFHTSINDALTEHARYGTTTVLLLFDLDHFKRINDTYGHLAGDLILKEVAEIVHGRLREADLFYRYGGEEFAILLPQTILQNAAFLADDLRQKIDTNVFSNGLGVTISAGLAEVQKGDDVTRWIARADTALYEAKGSGRNCVKIQIPELMNWNEGAQPA